MRCSKGGEGYGYAAVNDAAIHLYSAEGRPLSGLRSAVKIVLGSLRGSNVAGDNCCEHK